MGMPTASLIVRAPISAAARAGPRPRMTAVARSPSHATSSSLVPGSASRRSMATAAMSVSSSEPVHRTRTGGTRQHGGDRAHDHQRRRRRSSSTDRTPRPPPCRARRRRARRGCWSAVRHGHDARWHRARADALGDLSRPRRSRPTGSRPPRRVCGPSIAVRKCRSSAESSITAAMPAAREFGDGGVARVVGAPHAGEDQACDRSPRRRWRPGFRPDRPAPRRLAAGRPAGR